VTDAGREWQERTLTGLKVANEKADRAGVPVMPIEHRMERVPEDLTDHERSAWIKRLVTDDWPDDEEYGVEQRLERPIPITYVGIANLIGGSIPHGYSTRITTPELRQIDPGAVHEVLMGWRCHAPEHGTFVRLALNVMGRRGGQPLLLLHDVPPETWEALCGIIPAVPVSRTVNAMGLGEGKMGLDAGKPEEYRLGTADRPRWAGARAFDKVWDRCEKFAALANHSIDAGVDVLEIAHRHVQVHPIANPHLRATCGYAQTTLGALRAAHEILVDPDQVNAMPGFDSWEQTVSFARDLHLPFPSVFLDMEGPAGACAIEQAGDGMVLAMRGAHVHREGERLFIIPCAGITDPDDTDHGFTYAPMGMVVIGEPRPDDRRVWTIQNVLETGYMHQNICADATLANESEDRLPFQIPPESGTVCFTTHDAEGIEVDRRMVAVETGEMVAAALITLKTLWLLSMSNVEVVPAPLERQQRRQAQRQGIEIALAVHVHTSSKRYVGKASNGNGRQIEYSHRFRVRGHVKHYPPGTRMADARPDEVKPCPRCGRCRGVWTPPFIKGPDDKPLILKSLVVDD
jgi:hypothetical protein